MKSEITNILVLGMGSYAYGKEQRAVRALKQMNRVKPYFLIPKWGDGSVNHLLQQYNFEYRSTYFGYLGRTRPDLTVITLLHIPQLYSTVLQTCLKKQYKVILFLEIRSFVNAFPVVLLLRCLCHIRPVFYLGDIPEKNSINNFLGVFINRFVDRVITNSKAVKRGCSAVGIDKNKICVVYNGLDIAKFEYASPKNFRQRFNWSSKTVLVGYIGQFNLNKGVWDFIRAAELTLRKNKNCRFLMIGNIDPQNLFHQKMMQYINTTGLGKFIVFTGQIDEIEQAYAALDTVVVPSCYDDPAPNVNIEAMASGVPIVATRVGGSPELVVNGEAGFLVNKEDPKHLAECILKLASNKKLRKKIGRAGIKRAQKMFDVRKNASRIEELILYP